MLAKLRLGIALLALTTLPALAVAATTAASGRPAPAVQASATATSPGRPARLKIAPVSLPLDGGAALDAEEGTLVVPARRGKPAAGTVELHFVRVRGAAGSGNVATFYLAGGPGEAATGLLRGPDAGAQVAALRSLGDLVLLDQRGTGKSTPVPVCKPTAPLPDHAFVDGAAMLSATTDAVAQCAAEWRGRGVDLGAFSSREAADDVDDLRAALGYERVNLIGFSYGTSLALAVMRRHPEGVGRVVLVGTEGPDHTWKLPSTYDRQLGNLSALAAADASIGRDVPDMTGLLRRVLDRLQKHPVEVTIHDRASDRDRTVRVGSWGLLRLLRWDIGDGNDFIAFPALLHGIEHGDTTLLGRYVEKRWNQMGRGIALMPLATDCTGGASPLRRQQIDLEEPGSIFGAVTNYPFPEICAALGELPGDDEMRAPLQSSVPTLLISGTLDSNTPPYQAEEVRWGLARATHLIVDNAGHEDTLPDRRVQRAMLDFLAGEEVGDRHIALPAPRFLSLAAAREFQP